MNWSAQRSANSSPENIAKAHRKCRLCFAEWQAITNRIREMVEGHKNYSPEAFKNSISGLLPEYQRAAGAALAELQRFVQIKSGALPFSEDNKETKD